MSFSTFAPLLSAAFFTCTYIAIGLLSLNADGAFVTIAAVSIIYILLVVRRVDPVELSVQIRKPFLTIVVSAVVVMASAIFWFAEVNSSERNLVMFGLFCFCLGLGHALFLLSLTVIFRRL